MCTTSCICFVGYHKSFKYFTIKTVKLHLFDTSKMVIMNLYINILNFLKVVCEIRIIMLISGKRNRILGIGTNVD
jgi:hypothetical protein